MANDADRYVASLGEPALLYRGKGLIAVMNTRHHIGISPFANLAELANSAELAGLETTKSSIHLREGQTILRDLLEQLLLRRVQRIDKH